MTRSLLGLATLVGPLGVEGMERPLGHHRNLQAQQEGVRTAVPLLVRLRAQRLDRLVCLGRGMVSGYEGPKHEHLLHLPMRCGLGSLEDLGPAQVRRSREGKLSVTSSSLLVLFSLPIVNFSISSLA